MAEFPYGFEDEASYERFLEAGEELERERHGPLFDCAACGQRVKGPCSGPVDMGGGMIDSPCSLQEV